ncbi:hypothetical protein G6F65_015322 [Rhizopus arrhizus]|nr:hypothetical protein G6F65_015322 [Rhizopus arrhizus]
MRGHAFALAHPFDEVAQHVGKAIAGGGAVCASRHFVIQEQAVVAAQDRDVAHRAFGLEAAQRRDLFQTGPGFVLEHHARRQVRHDAPDDRRRHLHRKRQRVVLQHERHVVANGLDRLVVVGDDLVVGTQGVRRRNHHAGGSQVHPGARQRAHGSEARRRHAPHDGHAAGLADHLRGDVQRFREIQLRRFAQLA